MVVLEAVGLSKHFRARRGSSAATAAWCALSMASFAIERADPRRGRQSGCGKTDRRLVLGLEEPSGGSIRFEGKDSARSTPPGAGTIANRCKPCSRTYASLIRACA